MKLPNSSWSAVRRFSQSAFTMVEIAFSLAVIGIALVAILGVLPIGFDAQKNNRRETIINQDANYFVEAIRNGGHGLDDLTNYVTTITNYWTKYTAAGGFILSGVDSYTNAPVILLSQPDNRFQVTSHGTPIVDVRLSSGASIIGILSTPKFVPSPIIGDPAGTYISNYVVAYVRALSGAASEKFPATNNTVLESAFSYRMVAELNPVRVSTNDDSFGFYSPDATNYLADVAPADVNTANADVDAWSGGLATNGNPLLTAYLANLPTLTNNSDFLGRADFWLLSRQMRTHLYDLRLLFRWPLLPGGRIGNGRQVYRAMLSGSITNEEANPAFYFVRSRDYLRTP